MRRKRNAEMLASRTLEGVFTLRPLSCEVRNIRKTRLEPPHTLPPLSLFFCLSSLFLSLSISVCACEHVFLWSFFSLSHFVSLVSLSLSHSLSLSLALFFSLSLSLCF